jgi:transcriptional regulator with XRE-family HTH domain
MVDFALALPEEVCQEIGRRARTRRLSLNVSVDELAGRVGISSNTLGNFERTGRCTLETFVRILEVLNALPDLASVLVTQASSIDDMRQNVVTRTRKRAYTRARKASP